MNLHLLKSKLTSNNTLIKITGSKSESNRLLLLQALYPNIDIENLSNSDDSKVMQDALNQGNDTINIHHAGTAMRFLTAYFSIQKRSDVILTGSSRMQERPIQVLVEALNQLGAKITYLNQEGFPPLRVKGKTLKNHKVSLKADVSSQYISALLLIAPRLKNGLELTLKGTITSIPYINMTLALLNDLGVKTFFKNQTIGVAYTSTIKSQKITVESDWSSASYFYSIVALSDVDTTISLTSYKEKSLQGDSVLAEIYKLFGVQTRFNKNKVTLKKKKFQIQTIELDLNNSPDIAQTIAVTCLGLGIDCKLTGLHTLKIKETDRLMALKNEIEKLGAEVKITSDSLYLRSSKSIKNNVAIATYNDHRMAMAFAPLALKSSIIIEDAMVVSKSYPTFWNDLKTIGFNISK